LAALAGVLGLRRGRRRPWRCRSGTGKLRNRTQHLPTITEDDTEVFQVLIRQIAKDGETMRFSAKRSA
jgi:hypothetical protein